MCLLGTSGTANLVPENIKIIRQIERKRVGKAYSRNTKKQGTAEGSNPSTPTNFNLIYMGTRKRIRVKVGELGMKIQEQLDQRKAMFGEIVSDIMQEHSCSWEEAKKIYKRNKVERAINREFNLI